MKILAGWAIAFLVAGCSSPATGGFDGDAGTPTPVDDSGQADTATPGADAAPEPRAPFFTACDPTLDGGAQCGGAACYATHTPWHVDASGAKYELDLYGKCVTFCTGQALDCYHRDGVCGCPPLADGGDGKCPGDTMVCVPAVGP